MKLAFLFARWLGSPYHVISAFKAGIVFTFVALAPFSLIQEHATKARRRLEKEDSAVAKPDEWTPTRFAACTDRRGREYAGIEVVDVTAEGKNRGGWWSEELAQESLERCDRLADTFLKVHAGTKS